MATFSKNGKPLGRPPGTPTEVMPAVDKETLAVAKALQTFRARYDAAGRGRRMASWTPPSSGPNDALEGLQTIRDRSRDASRNDWAGESSVQKWATSLIGIGITPRFNRIKAKKRKQEITDLWADFAAASDADCVLGIYGQQTLAVRSWIESGEVFARRRPRFSDEGLPVPFQVQLLESDMVPLLDADSYQGLPQGNKIRSGIEIDKRGKRVAYWVYKQHPGDMNGTVIQPESLVRVAASDMIHMFEQKRPGQLRGVSALATVLTRIRNIGDYEDATLDRQKIANLWVGFITRTLPTLDPNDINVGALTGLEQEVTPEGQGLLPLKPGLIQELEDGQNFQFANPPEAGTNYSDYLRTSHLGTAAASGLPYEVFSGDIREVSDRTLRVLINEFRRFAEQRQWQIVIPQFCQRVVEWFADAAALAGKITLDEAALVRRVEHAPHGWAYIHPVQDVQGKALEVENGFRSRSSVIGERGDDPDRVDAERKMDKEREDALGITPQPAAPAGQNGTPASDPQKPDKPVADKPEQSTAVEKATVAKLQAEEALLLAKAKAVATPAPAPVPTPTPTATDERTIALTESIVDLLGRDVE